MTKKINGLTFKFAIVFTIFAVTMLILSGFLTYANQTQTYTEQCIEKAKELDSYLEDLMQAEGDDVITYIDYYMDNYRDIEMDYDFDEYETAWEKYDTIFNQKYPGKTLGVDIELDDLSSDVQQAYFEYTHKYWVLTFESARDAFGMSYAYFLVMGDERARTENFDEVYGPGKHDAEHSVLYLIDGERTEAETENENGESVGTGNLWLGDSYYNAPDKQHEVEWETWNKGRPIDRYQEWDNEWGHTYTYYTPLIINGRKLGLIATEIDVKTVNEGILRTSLIQTGGIAVILVILIVIVLFAINRLYISKLEKLESRVSEYASEKDPEIAVRIKEEIAGKNEISSLSEKTADMITELDTYMTHIQTITAEKERIGAELEVATRIQADMLPKDFPERSDFSLYASMTPAKEVGGDFYDFFMIDDDHLGLVMADVSGKGVPAALFMVVAKTLLKIRTTAPGTPKDILYDVNNTLCENNASGLFVTVWFGILTLSTGDLISANAGHEYPALKKNSGDFELVVSEHCPPLAAMEGIEFENKTIHLNNGDQLFLYTDGVPEAKNAVGERSGTEKMIEYLNKYKDMPPEDMLKNLKNEIDSFAGECDPFDDITMLGIKLS